MPIVQYNDRQEETSQNQNQALAQLNVVLLEEFPVSTVQMSSSNNNSKQVHWHCDCAKCIQIEIISEEIVPQTLAVTRSKKPHPKSSDNIKEKEHPIEWQAQKYIRIGVIKEI